MIAGMSDAQYRCLVAYLNFWTPQHPNMNLDAAIKDCGISAPAAEVVNELFRAGWTFNESTGLLTADEAIQ